MRISDWSSDVCSSDLLNETKDFDPDGIEAWMREWEVLYDCIRGLEKPFVIALNGLAAGSAFQVALLADFRIGHDGCQMGQPEINAGVASNTGDRKSTRLNSSH